MRAHTRRHPADLPPLENAVATAADAYNQAGNDYLAYADGTAKELYAFDGRYGYGDRQIWTLLEKKLIEIRSRGAESGAILDETEKTKAMNKHGTLGHQLDTFCAKMDPGLTIIAIALVVLVAAETTTRPPQILDAFRQQACDG